MRLEDTIDKQITTYPDLYWDLDRPHARRRVLNEMFINPNSDFEWTKDGYLFNTNQSGVQVECAPAYGRRKHDVFVDMAWLEENKGRQRRGPWMPTPFDESCNLLNVPENVQPDYLEAAWEIAQQTIEFLKTQDPKRYRIMPSDSQMMRDVDTVLDGKDDNFDVAHPYHKAHEDGILSLEWAIEHETKRAQSKMNLMRYAIEDTFLPFYDKVKKMQKKIKVYLDDNRKTPDGFDVHVYDANQLIQMIDHGNVEFVSLDNDLGPYCTAEGYKVAQYIEEQAFHNTLPRIAINVHSANTVASNEMNRAIAQSNKFWKEHEEKVT